MAKNPQDVLNDWVQKTSGSTNKYKSGVMSVQTAPTQLAAQQSAYWQQRVSSPEALQKFISGCNRVGLAEWQRITSEKGAQNLATGVNAAKDKMLRALQFSVPLGQQIKQAVASMPKGGIENGLARVRAAITMTQQAYAGRS